MEEQSIRWSADRTHLLRSPELAYKSCLQALEVLAGDHLIVDPLLDEALLQAILALKLKPIFIDFSSTEKLEYDTDLLEDFLSLSSMVNGEDHLIYRKDNRIIRAIVLTHHQGKSSFSERLAFISRRYHLPIIEDFSTTFSMVDLPTGSYGQVSVAKVKMGNQLAGMLLQRMPKFDPLSFRTSVQKKELFEPNEIDLFQEETSDLQPQAFLEEPDYPNRLEILKKHVFLTRTKVTEKLLSLKKP